MPKLMIVWEDGEPVMIPAGGPIEASMVDIIVREIQSRKNFIGYVSELTMRQAIETALFNFKGQIKSVPISNAHR